jgi:hypothetical protein
LIAFPILPCWKPALHKHALGEIFQIDLMDDADAGRHDLERVERLHAPFEKLVALAIAPEFHLQIFLHRIHAAGKIHLHRMVHHQVHRHERLDDFRIFAQPLNGGAHRRQVHQQRHAGKILQHDARNDKWNFFRAGADGLPIRQRADGRFAHAFAIAIAEHRLEHEADGDGQFGNRPDPGLFQRRQGIKRSLTAVTEFKFPERVKQIVRCVHLILSISNESEGEA